VTHYDRKRRSFFAEARPFLCDERHFGGLQNGVCFKALQTMWFSGEVHRYDQHMVVYKISTFTRRFAVLAYQLIEVRDNMLA